MRELGHNGELAWLWEDAASNSHRLMMLDYDGTLAPFTIDRPHAWPHPVAIAALGAIAASRATQVAIISGRPARELEALLGPIPAWFVGEHGWEVLSPEGDLSQYDIAPESEEGLRLAFERAEGEGCEALLERKRACLSLHLRGLTEEAANSRMLAVERLWRPLTSIAGLRLARLDGRLELRALGHDKGTAVRDLVRWIGSDAMAIYIGDDDSDEDAFAQISGRGLGILVAPEDRPTIADARLPSCDAVAEFLAGWANRVEGRGPELWKVP
jgi:trehalose-phosphatase